MLNASVNLGLTLLIVLPLLAGMAIIWFGLHNPKTGAGRWVYKWWPFGVPQSVTEKTRREEAEAAEELAEATRVVPMETRLRKLKIGQFLTMMGTPVDCVGIAKLLELQYFGADKSIKVHVSPSGETLREFPWFTLGDDQIILEIPIGEGKRLSWFIGQEISGQVDVALAEFMGGTPGSTGPAKEFAMSNQSAKVVFTIPGVEGTWRAVDIVWMETRVEGENLIENYAKFAMLLAKQLDGNDYLLFSDLRSGGGSDLLWRLRQFEPNRQIEDM